jgi:fluoride ion exporter CrcB/FEX
MNQFLLVFSVGIINVIINIFLSRSAKTSDSFPTAIFNINFLIALIVGMLSILAILYVYKSNLNLAQGVILMGAISIIIGTIYGVVFQNNKISVVEMLIFIILILLYFVRWVYK